MRITWSPQLSVLALTLSIQGLPIASQILVGLMVGPTTLGEIRWLESVFVLALLATSCGMPSLVFRQSAVFALYNESLSFAIIALTLTTLASCVFLAATALLTLIGFAPSIPTQQAYLFIIIGTLIPANAIRILIAHTQGREATHHVCLQVLGFALVAILTLGCAALVFGTGGWVVARFTLELALVLILWLLIRRLAPTTFSPAIPTFRMLGKIGAQGLAPNYAFLVRAFADNLPILILPKLLNSRDEIGLYSLATLMMFAPLLLISTAMQAQLPRLIQASGNRDEFAKSFAVASRKVYKLTAAGLCIMTTIAAALHLNVLGSQYSNAAALVLLLAAGLPARAFLVVSGGAAVARGWFATSSMIAIFEIIFLGCAVLFGLITNVVHMAVCVTLATWLAALPAYLLLLLAKKSTRTQT
jgi:O-antigen/teichoic acid export membrane protein